MDLNNLPYVVKNYLIKYLTIEILIILYDNFHYHDIIVNYLKNNKVDWNYISRYQKLPEKFIRKFQDKVNWDYILKYQNLTEKFIREFQNKVN